MTLGKTFCFLVRDTQSRASVRPSETARNNSLALRAADETLYALLCRTATWKGGFEFSEQTARRCVIPPCTYILHSYYIIHALQKRRARTLANKLTGVKELKSPTTDAASEGESKEERKKKHKTKNWSRNSRIEFNRSRSLTLLAESLNSAGVICPSCTGVCREGDIS